ncbi:MAG: DUF5640 domain-containing protein [Defluviitaleaceae bacterium]|nr:DUF5640 domain-containing protein [Defluviitaleaceae bacterium]MCL2264281.1 DUF5640 domain-containing protein [Defluviitaleaceae bacterium]
MKKFFVLLFLVGLLAGCSAGHNEYLIGEWLWAEDGAYTYVFNYDGTGERGFPENMAEFTWSTNRSRLNISHETTARNEIRDEVWDFEIYEGVLTITNDNRTAIERGHSFSYFPAILENNDALIGTWAWEDDQQLTYIFSADGTGTRGFPGENDSFTWAADNSRLNIIRYMAAQYEVRGEFWTLEQDGNRITITNSQIEDTSLSLVRVS